jgi:hypothetical protein
LHDQIALLPPPPRGASFRNPVAPLVAAEVFIDLLEVFALDGPS